MATESARLRRHWRGGEELSHVQGQGWWPRRATPLPRSELARSVGAQSATGKITQERMKKKIKKKKRKNEGMVPKQKQYPVVDVTSDRSKV